ncbi:protein of unknown function [Methylocaldum szegediense]|uniref:Uncharacterized protein n=1 Tax=Methylocaldum szegediense TaxID=73780 RepID=A0ABM9I4L4_9GAMM|nr:protein of unknown function [Methylocaldum szegediense]
MQPLFLHEVALRYRNEQTVVVASADKHKASHFCSTTPGRNRMRWKTTWNTPCGISKRFGTRISQLRLVLDC